jgi:hypothetical protein
MVSLQDLSMLVNGNTSSLGGLLDELLVDRECWEDEGDVFLTSRECGIEIKASSNGEVTSVFLFADGVDAAKQYEGEIPGGLSFDLGRREVRGRLGEPDQGNGARVFLGRQVYPWDRFNLPEFSLRVTYSLNEASIRQFTLMRRSAFASVPGESS